MSRAARQASREKPQRIQLVARVRTALNELREAAARRYRDPARACAAIAAAERRLSVLNRSLALLALDAEQRAA